VDSVLLAFPLAIWPPPVELMFLNNEAAKEVKFNRTPEKDELGCWTLDSTEWEWKSTPWFQKGTLLFAFLLSQRLIMTF
jgi:hypothetical protein